jgi:biopolymer transport protein ExbD
MKLFLTTCIIHMAAISMGQIIPKNDTLAFPVESKTIVKTNDSANFTIFISNDGYHLTLAHKTVVLHSRTELDKFIKTHKAVIDKKQVIVVGTRDIPYQKFKPVIELLKKYRYYRFQMMVKEE